MRPSKCKRIIDESVDDVACFHRLFKMQNPYSPPSVQRLAAAKRREAITVRAVLLAPLAAFACSLVLAGIAGVFIALLGGSLLDANGDTTIAFNIIFFPSFVWLPYLLCGIVAGRIAESRPVRHALYAGCVFLVANVAMAFPLDADDPFSWTDAISYALIVPLAMLGGKLVNRWS